jgi:hypothetical protein
MIILGKTATNLPCYKNAQHQQDAKLDEGVCHASNQATLFKLIVSWVSGVLQQEKEERETKREEK